MKLRVSYDPSLILLKYVTLPIRAQPRASSKAPLGAVTRTSRACMVTIAGMSGDILGRPGAPYQIFASGMEPFAEKNFSRTAS